MSKCTSFLFFCAWISTEFCNPHIASIKHLIYSICNQFLHCSYIQPLIHKYMAINHVVKHKLYHIHKDPGKDGEPLWRKIWCDGIGNNLFAPDNSVACVWVCDRVTVCLCVMTSEASPSKAITSCLCHSPAPVHTESRGDSTTATLAMATVSLEWETLSHGAELSPRPQSPVYLLPCSPGAVF